MGNYQRMKKQLNLDKDKLDKANKKSLELDNKSNDIKEQINNLKISKLNKDNLILSKEDKEKLIKYIDEVNGIISESGDVLRLSAPDKKLIALALMLKDEGKNIKVISDDYTIQNTLKIINIPYSGIITEGIKGVYNWKKICEGCKKEFDENYPFDDCDVCGSRIFKKRIKL